MLHNIEAHLFAININFCEKDVVKLTHFFDRRAAFGFCSFKLVFNIT